jgi:hypothetical protein
MYEQLTLISISEAQKNRFETSENNAKSLEKKIGKSEIKKIISGLNSKLRSQVLKSQSNRKAG